MMESYLMKRTYTKEERDLVFDLWKRGAGFSEIGRVLDAKPGSIFTILREHGVSVVKQMEQT
jgi:hypothetical protein